MAIAIATTIAVAIAGVSAIAVAVAGGGIALLEHQDTYIEGGREGGRGRKGGIGGELG